MSKDEAPYPPQLTAVGMDTNFIAMPPHAPFPVLLQARVVLQSIDLSRPGQTRTEWFALTPAVARRMAQELQDAAAQAEKPHLPPAGPIQ